MAALITGLDLGGAHLKAAQVAADGRVVAGAAAALRALAGPRPAGARRWPRPVRSCSRRQRVAVTMTGELVDLFPDRQTGVARLLSTPWRQRGPRPTARSGPGAAASSRSRTPPAHTGAIASANWLASATLVARRVGHGLFVDLGSTTTDILVLAGGEVRAQGLTDRERLAAGELVYTGPHPHAGHGAGRRGAVRRAAGGR